MKKLLIFVLALSASNAFAFGCNETKAGERLIERIERIRQDCVQMIKKRQDNNRISSQISSCKTDALITLQQGIQYDITREEFEEASDIVDRYERDIKRQL